jgi:beta-N-acetylhexosaminidase
MPDYTSGMTLEEQIGQVLAVGFHETTPSPDIIDLIQKHHIGNIILFSRNIQNIQQIRELTHSLQMIAKEAGHRSPLLISIDHENGTTRRFGQSATTFPGNMTLGAIDSEQITYDIALATGRELKALGINMNLAPVVDVNNNPANPIIGTRSFGEDPHQVARLGAAMVRGYQAAGIVTTLKHFPGHGDTSVDSHLALPIIPYTMERLTAIELVPFKSCIEAGADSVMIGHMYLPALMQDEMTPSTVSHAIVTTLLREKLGFTGMIISDCLEMQAVADTVGVEQGAVMGLQAGIDLILISHQYARQRGSIEAIQAALRAGILSTDRVRQAAEQVLHLKARTLSWDDLPDAPLASLTTEATQHLRDCAYELSTTLVRNADELLPLRLDAEQRLLVLFPQPTFSTPVIEANFAGDTLVEGIRQRHKHVDTLSIAPQSTLETGEAIRQAVNRADVVLVVTMNANLDPYQGEFVQQLLQMGRPIIGIASSNPYDLLAFPELRTCLATYEYTPPAFAAAVRVLFGEVQARGHLPVSIPGLYPLGHD